MTSQNQDLEGQLTVIKRGLVQIHSEAQLLEKFKNSRETGVPLRIKFGADPSSSDLHVGHAVALRKLRQFQDFGHKVVLIIGDFTAMIGDPTGRSKTRPVLSLEQTRENGASYVAQVSRILDDSTEKLEVVYNSEWLMPLNFRDVIQLAQSYTVARMLERNDFSERYRSGVPIGIHEFMYPLTQGYDSVAVRADVELGGTDQLFNLLVGRDTQRAYGIPEQVVITTPLLNGIDGSDKMSKSLGNTIGLTDPADLIYKKAMQVLDPDLFRFFELCTSIDLDQVQKEIVADSHQAHRILARDLVRLYHGSDSVAEAEARYNQVAQRNIPDQIKAFNVPAEEIPPDGIGICRLLVLAGLASSNGDARRLIEQKGIRIDGEPVSSTTLKIQAEKPFVLQRGRDQFVKVSR